MDVGVDEEGIAGTREEKQGGMGMGRGEIKEKKRKEGRTKTKEGKGMKVTRTVLCRLLLRLIWEGMWVVYDILFLSFFFLLDFIISVLYYYYYYYQRRRPASEVDPRIVDEYTYK